MILYFSGTGNSRYIAERIAVALGDELLSMNDRIKAGDTSPVTSDERLIIVTPTYAWRIPNIVRDWLAETNFPSAKQAWFVMTCGRPSPLCVSSGVKYQLTPMDNPVRLSWRSKPNFPKSPISPV